MEQLKPNTTFRIAPGLRKTLAEFLRPEIAESQIAWLEKLVTPDRRSLHEVMHREQPRHRVTPAQLRTRYSRAISAIESLAEVVPGECRGILESQVQVLRLERDRASRNPDARILYVRAICGWVGKCWSMAARDPADRLTRRRFAIRFLDACSIGHPGLEHPERLDPWLDQDWPPGWRDVWLQALLATELDR